MRCAFNRPSPFRFVLGVSRFPRLITGTEMADRALPQMLHLDTTVPRDIVNT